MDIHKRQMATKLDIGGYTCPCCGPKDNGGKKVLSRYARRTLKKELKQLLEE